jgi:hypothetical protein
MDGRPPGQSPGLAGHGRLAPADRPVAQRAGPATPGGDGGPVGAARAVAGARCRPVAAGLRRHAHPAVHVLPPVAVAGVADRADPARGRWSDHSGDSARVPRTGSDHDPADQPGQAARQGQRGPVRRAAGRGARRTARGRPARPLPDLQRGVRQHGRPAPAARRVVGRGDPAGADRAPLGCAPGRVGGRRRRGHRAARADAPHRRAPARSYRPGRRADPAGRAGPQPLERRPDRRGRGADQRGAAAGTDRPVPAPGRDRRGARRGAQRRGDRLAADRGPVRGAVAGLRQSGGGVEPRRRGGDGPWPARRARAGRQARRRQPDLRRPQVVRGAGAPVGDGRRPGRRAGRLPAGGPADDVLPATALPTRSGRAACREPDARASGPGRRPGR